MWILKTCLIANPPFTKPPFVNSRGLCAARRRARCRQPQEIGGEQRAIWQRAVSSRQGLTRHRQGYSHLCLFPNKVYSPRAPRLAAPRRAALRRVLSNRGSQFPEPVLMFTSSCPLLSGGWAHFSRLNF